MTRTSTSGARASHANQHAWSSIPNAGSPPTLAHSLPVVALPRFVDSLVAVRLSHKTNLYGGGFNISLNKYNVFKKEYSFGYSTDGVHWTPMFGTKSYCPGHVAPVMSSANLNKRPIFVPAPNVEMLWFGISTGSGDVRFSEVDVILPPGTKPADSLRVRGVGTTTGVYTLQRTVRHSRAATCANRQYCCLS